MPTQVQVQVNGSCSVPLRFTRNRRRLGVYLDKVETEGGDYSFVFSASLTSSKLPRAVNEYECLISIGALLVIAFTKY